jgi:hypothetical protein
MEYNTALEIVKAHDKQTFTITWSNGTKTKNRLFVSSNGMLCEFKKGCRRWGYPISPYNIVSIECIVKKVVTPVDIFRRNVKNVIKYLSASGLWSPMLETAKVFLTLPDEVLLKANDNWDTYHALMNGDLKGYQWFGIDCFFHLFTDKAIKTVNYDRWSREYDTKAVADHIANKQRYSIKWRKGYDNSLELKFEDNCPYHRGWYSEEYKDCGNGHYYFLLDEKHVLFGEND